MKRKNLHGWIYIFPLLSTMMASCSYEEVPTYKDVDRIFFKYAGERDESDVVDKMSINLGYDKPLKDDSIIAIPVKLMGNISNVNREVKAKLIAEESTAVEGEDIEILPSYLPAGGIVGSVFVKLKRTENIAANTLLARIHLVSNESFHTDYPTSYSDPRGDRNGLTFSLYFTALADKPGLWIAEGSRVMMEQFFSVYSNEKINLICEVCGFTRDYFEIDPADNDPSGRATANKRFPNAITFGIISQVNRYLKAYKETHGGQPKLDEFGNEIKMGLTII